MRFVRFLFHDAMRTGTTDGTRVWPFASDVRSLQAYLALDDAARAASAQTDSLALADVELLAPIVPAKNVFCVGRNYLAHAQEGARASGKELKLPDVPTFFTKAPTAIADPGSTLRLDASVSSEYDFEAELAIVIGTRVRDVAEADVPAAIFGYTCLNDVTARDLQRAHLQWFKGKSLDDTCPIGPWIVSADEVGDPQMLDISLRVDGEFKQRSNTSQMIFSVRKIVAALSRGMTLEAGDVIATGTPDGVGFARTPPEFLRDGQRMTIEIAKIGTLENRVAIHAA